MTSQIPTVQPSNPSRPDNMSKGEKSVDIEGSGSKATSISQKKGKKEEEDPLIVVAKQRPQDQQFVDFLKGL